MSNEIQQGLQDDLTTIEPDLMNMTRLFSLPDSVWDAPEYHFAAAIEGGQYVIRFYGKTQAAQGVTDIPSDADARIQALHRRRALRRLCRQTLYDLLRKETGIHPPWGSMTGIRPTHLMYEALNEGMSMADAQKHLVHQFDVAPEKAALLAELVSVQQQLPPPGDDWMDVYIGIPFCPTRCAYCSFVSASVEKSFKLMEPYLAALTAEVEAAGRMVKETGLRIKSFYMGGGTPTTLSANQMDALLTAVNRNFDLSDCVEYCIEAGRPDTIDREKLQVLLDHGADRISVNPQSLEPRVLSAIGRKHSPEDIEKAMELATSMGFPHVNMDLIAGLPGDTPDGFRTTLEQVLALAPENITVHTLSRKRGADLSQQTAPVPDGAQVGEMLDFANTALDTAGYAPYYLYRQKFMSGGFENVGWTRPGQENLYNICIMEELCSILAMGGGASTKLVCPGGRLERHIDPKYPTEYIANIDRICAAKAKLEAFFL